MGSERGQTILLTHETSSFMKALRNSIFSRRNIRREEIKSSLLHISKCECSGCCGLHLKGLMGLVVSLTLHDKYQPPSPSDHFLSAVLKVCMGPILRR